MRTIGVDVGGTFTDIILFDSMSGKIAVHKIPSTPNSQDIAVVRGIEEILQREQIEPESIDSVVHGTTVATNAMLERKGARVGLVTTKGIEDVLEIGRQNRFDIYDIHASRPEPLVRRSDRIGVAERLDSKGIPLLELTEEEIKGAISRIKELDLQSIAISLLFSYQNPKHELQLLSRIKQETNLYTVASSGVLPEFREYERTSTTVLEAYLGPLVISYLEKLEDSLRTLCPKAKLTVMQSNGGTILCSETEGRTIGLAISGLAGGVIGGWNIGRNSGYTKSITLDMGGTSCDISSVVEKIIVRPDNDVEGLPIRVPAVDVKTIGAGGGSIAWIDEIGVLHVGPQSAGAEPGPAAYGKGGEKATVTDANLLLGRLNPHNFLGGRVPLDVVSSRDAIKRIAESLSLSIERAALGIIKISTTNMVQAIREVTVERGHDPRTFTLIPFGGAGPTQSCEIAEVLGINQVLVPPYPGITSAYGLIVADFRVDTMKSVMLTGKKEDEKIIQAVFVELKQKTITRLVKQGVDENSVRFELGIDMRYAGQSHELAVAVSDNSTDYLTSSRELFERIHEQEFGYRLPDREIEWVTVRVVGVAPQLGISKTEISQRKIKQNIHKRTVIMPDGKEYSTRIFQREGLQEGEVIEGPAIVEQLDTTIVIPPSWRAIQQKNGTMIIRRLST